MLKYSFLAHHLDYSSFLEKLQEKGMVHVIKKKKELSESLREQLQHIKNFETAIKFLEKRKVENGAEHPAADEYKGIEILENLEKLKDELERLEQDIHILKNEKAAIEPWGDFSVDMFKKLKESGIKLHFYTIAKKKFNEKWHDKYTIEIINEVSASLYFVVFAPKKEHIEIDAEEVRAPVYSFEEFDKKITDKETRIKAIHEEFDKIAKTQLPVLQKRVAELKDKLEFEDIVSQTEKQAEEKLMIIEGWLPKTKKDEFEAFVSSEEIVYLCEEPTKEDNVPILLKNNKFSKLFEPIGKLYSLPDYAELDLTPFFAPFFMLFFGFCLGDAGYGILFVLLGIFMKPKAKPAMKPFLKLGVYLGIATILFGIISGTFFGINLIDSGYGITEKSIVIAERLKVPDDVLTNYSALKGEYVKTKSEYTTLLKNKLGQEQFETYQNQFLQAAKPDISFLWSFRYLLFDTLKMFYLAIVIGLIQIVFGIVIRAINQIKQHGFQYALSPIGWILLIIGGLDMAMFKLTGFAANIVVYAGLALIVFFSDPSIGIFGRIGKGIWDLYGITGLMGDVLSYIRLFALGISSAILGFVFNDIGMQILGSAPVIGHIFFIIFMLFGHGLNIALAALGAFVHPMRLTFVEFYKNAGFAGGGKEYKPFRKINN